ncbi:MAG: hypothetical protein ACOYD6_05855 [Limnochordia bacterium]
MAKGKRGGNKLPRQERRKNQRLEIGTIGKRQQREERREEKCPDKC